MDAAPKGLSIDLYFTRRSPPEVWKIVFKSRPPQEIDDDFEFERKGSKNKPTFDWSPGIIGFVLALLHHRLSGGQEFKGPRNGSPAASARSAIYTQKWLRGGFGDAEHTGREIGKEIFTAPKDPNGQNAIIRIDVRRLPPEHIRIFMDAGQELVKSGDIQNIYNLIGKHWTPHHKGRAKAAGVATKADLAKPKAQDPGAGKLSDDKPLRRRWWQL